MKRQLAVLALFSALIYGATAYTRPESPPGVFLHSFDAPISAACKRAVRSIPFSGLLDWDGMNDYQPRPTKRPLEVVSPAAAGYTPEELAEIYFTK